MKSWQAAAVVGCLLGVGCAGPLDRPWDDPVYRSVRERYGASDAQGAGLGDENTEHDPTGGALGSLERLTVEDAVRIGVANAPGLRRAGYEVDIADGLATQAGLLPNPSFVFEGEGLGDDDGAGGETIYHVEQAIVLGGRLRKARDLGDADRMAARAAFLSEERALAARVTGAYFAAVAARERLDSRRELGALSERVLGAARAQVEAGAATEPDRLRAEVVLEQAQIGLAEAELAYGAALRALGAAMGLGGPVGLPLATGLDAAPELGGLEELTASALANNGRVALASIGVERARLAHALARAEATPDLIASVGPRYSDPDGETTVDVGLGVEIPLFDRNQGAIRAAVGERLASAARLQGVRLDVAAEVGEAWAAYEASRVAATRYRERLLPRAERTLELTRQAYERGKADYLRLLDAQQVVVESRVAYVDALERLHENAALLIELTQPGRGRDAGVENGAEVRP